MIRPALLSCLPLLLLAPATVHAASVVWSDDFTRTTGPTTYDFAGGAAGNDYTATPATTNTTGVSTSLNSDALRITDAGAGQFAMDVVSTQFAPFSLAAGDIVTLSLDVNVTSFVATNAASTFRFGLADGNLNNGTARAAVGWGYANIADGDGSTTDLMFYATTNVGTTPTAANVVGFSGGAWTPGFDFGDYNSGSATSNDTGGWYNISMSFTQGSAAVSGLITNLSNPGQTAAFNLTMLTPLNWATNDAADAVNILSGLGGTGVFDVDNISVSVTNIPEPSTAVLGGLALVGLLRRRRR